MIYFTADLHFGHANIIKHCDRPFADAEEMDRTLIRRWNDKVDDQDTVYILGDLFFRCREPEPILRELKGKKRLILGNHDDSWTSKVELSSYFESVDLMLETTLCNHRMTLCHYPLMEWKHDGHAYMIHGHIHNNTAFEYWNLIRERERILNAGVEVNRYAPVTFEELVENNRKFKEEH